MISEKGMLRDTPAIKLLLSIFEQRLTGILYLKREETLKVLYFNRGKFTWAISNAVEDRLETLLIDRKLIDGDTVELFRKSVKVPESLGKTLVENGLLTLENLVAITRMQLEKIVASVLAWSTGAFQFVRDTPPERLVSLDMEIPIMVHHCIQEYLEMDQLWKEIGTLQVVLQTSTDSAKLSLYPLSEHQKRIMAAFRQPATLETALPQFSETPQHPVLKSIYFLMISGLLVKAEKRPAASPPVTEADPPRQEPVAPPAGPSMLDDRPVHQPISIDLPPPEEEKESLSWVAPPTLPQELIGAGEPPSLESAGEDEGLNFPAPAGSGASEAPPPGASHEIDEDDFLQAELRPHRDESAAGPGADLPRPFANTLNDSGSRQRRLRWIIALTVIGLAAGGIYLLLLRSTPRPETRSETAEPVARPRANRLSPAAAKAPTADASEAKPGPDQASAPIAAPGPRTTPAQNPAPKPPPVVPARETTTARPSQPVGPTKPERTEPARAKPALDADPWTFFRAGSLLPAADVWREELKRSGSRFSILIELDCLKESVEHAYRQFEAADRRDFFLLNRHRNGRTCWLVLWGRFDSLAEAQAALSRVPRFFFQQSEPPSAVDISPYL